MNICVATILASPTQCTVPHMNYKYVKSFLTTQNLQIWGIKETNKNYTSET